LFVVQPSKLLFFLFFILVLASTIGCGGRPGTTEVAQSRPEPPSIPNSSFPDAQATQPQAGAQSSMHTGTTSPAVPSSSPSNVPQPSKPQARTQTGTTQTAAASIQHNVYLSWAQSPSSVQGYYIYRALSAFGPFTRLNQTPEPATLYSDSTVLSGKVYFYTVTSVNSNGESAYSSIIKAVIPTP